LWKLGHYLIGKNDALIAGLRREQGDVGGDHDFLTCRAYFELGVDGDGAYFKGNGATDDLVEAVSCEGDLVIASKDGGSVIDAILIGHEVLGDAGVRIENRDRDAGDKGSSRIGDAATNFA